MLQAAGFKRPTAAVHGHLTVNGEKMSKTRGTFITARDVPRLGPRPELPALLLRGEPRAGLDDLDLSLKDFRTASTASS